MTGHINSSAKHENCNFWLQLVYITEHLGMLKLPERLCNFFYLPVWLTFVIGPLLWQQAPTSNINHCVLTICNLKFVNQVECLVGFEPELRTFQFDHNALIHLATLPKWKKISSRWLFNFFGFLDFLFEHTLLLNKARKNCIQMWSNIFYWKISIYMLFEIVKF